MTVSHLLVSWSQSFLPPFKKEIGLLGGPEVVPAPHALKIKNNILYWISPAPVLAAIRGDPFSSDSFVL